MRRTIAVWVLAVIGASGLLSRAQAPRGDVELSQDPAYRATEGDRAEIVGEKVPAADGRAVLNVYVGARDRGDRAKMEGLENLADVVRLSRRTAVQVTRVYGPPRIRAADPLRGFSMEEYQRAMKEAIAREGPNPAGYPVEVRVIDGPHVGKVLVVEKDNVGRLVWRKPAVPDGGQDDLRIFNNPPKKMKSPVRPAPKTPPSRPVDPATQAASTLQMGKNVRFQGNRAAAIGYFRKAIGQAPDSAAAKEAKGILKEMGEK